MKKNNKKIFFAVFINLILLSCFSLVAQAQLINPEVVTDINLQDHAFAEEAGFNFSANIGNVVRLIIEGFLGLLAVIFIILIIYAGYNWMTAAGDEAKVTKAKETIQRAIIGLIIIVAAYSITYFVFKVVPFGGSGGGGGGGMPL